MILPGLWRRERNSPSFQNTKRPKTAPEERMGASFLDLNILLDKVQAGKWAAISRNKAEFIADADTPEELLKLANDWGEPDPIVVRVPKTSPSLRSEERRVGEGGRP